MMFMRLILIFMLIFTNAGCSVNILENFADKQTNEALYHDALRLMNQGLYEAALAKISEMTTEYSSSRKITALKAQAYAGTCGLNFMSLALSLKDLGTNRILPFLVQQFRGGVSVAKMDACLAAENLIESIGTVTARTTDENLLLALVSFAKLGAILSFYTDGDQDGGATAAYDICTAAAAGTRTPGGTMPDDDARELGSGLALAIENIGAVAGEVDLGQDSLDGINDACAALGGASFCTKTDPATFTAMELLAIRSLVKEGSNIGLNLGACGGNGVGTAACRCFP